MGEYFFYFFPDTEMDIAVPHRGKAFSLLPASIHQQIERGGTRALHWLILFFGLKSGRFFQKAQVP